MRSQTDILNSLISGIETKNDTKIGKNTNLYNTLWEMSNALHGLYMQSDKYLLSGLIEFMPNETSKILDQQVSLLSSLGSELEIKRQDAVATTVNLEANVLQAGVLNKGFKVKFGDYDFLLDETIDLTITGPIELQFSADLEGSEANILKINDKLEVSESTDLIETELTVTEIITQGKDQETVDNFRERILQKQRQPAHGGAAVDYVNWSLEAGDFVFRSTAYTSVDNPGQIDIYIETTYRDVLGIPTTDELTKVHDYFYDNNFLPLNSAVKIEPITRTPINIQVKANSTALGTDGKDNIESALEELIYNKVPYLFGQSRTPENAELTYAEIYSTTAEVVSNYGGKLNEVIATFTPEDTGVPEELVLIESKLDERFYLEGITFVAV